jgi:hypothetical protein
MQTTLDCSDGDLARAVAARDPGPGGAAESELYRRFAPRVRWYGLRHLRDEEAARDLVQQVMLLVIEKRMFSLLPGETVPCAIFPGDDLVVAALRADFAGVDAVTLSVTGPAGSPIAQFEDVPVPGSGGELFWVSPAAVVHEMPSMRLEIMLASADAPGVELGRYVLEHTAVPPPA